MATSQRESQSDKSRFLKRVPRIRVATLLMLSFIGFAGAISGAWFAGERTTNQIFTYLSFLQRNPPSWISYPEHSWEYLLAPTVILFLIVLAVMKVSPQPKQWSRAIVVGILLALTIRYALWRSLSTLNLTNPLNGIFSLSLLFLEMLGLLTTTIQLFLTYRITDRQREADRMAVAVMDGSFSPSVDILIPTYNEPAVILKRTVVGCQAIEYVNKRVYLLDDTCRPEIQQLAKELGCDYITRSDNQYAKAGNLNNAIAQTHGEMIAVFDADFVPTKNFLIRTVGFFQIKKTALIQTPQSFYNPDPVARNLGVENVLTSDEEIFYRQIQLIKDGCGSAICSGTSFVIRRSALLSIGGFITDALSEDYFTGICLSAQGYRLIYLNEKLSAGLAAENMAAYVTQRLRWARGTLQAFFIYANPLTIPGLGVVQRLAHLEGLLQWFTSLSRALFLVMPLAYAFISVIPIRTTFKESLYFFLPYYLLQLSTFSWLNYHSRSALISDVYAVVKCFPVSLAIIQTMLNPFSQGFKVTQKGVSITHYTFNWSLAWPLIILFLFNAVSLWQNLEMCLTHSSWLSGTSTESISFKGLELGWIWSAYNLLIISVALLVFFNVPKPSPYEWFDLRRVVRLNVAGQIFWGVTTMISEVGAQVTLSQQFPLAVGETLPVTLEIMDEQLPLQGQIIHTGLSDEFPTVEVEFLALSLPQQRRLIELLFCRPGQWKRLKVPGELQSLLLLFKVLLKPNFLFRRNRKTRAVAVSQS